MYYSTSKAAGFELESTGKRWSTILHVTTLTCPRKASHAIQPTELTTSFFKES
jgi:hypothetical protein